MQIIVNGEPWALPSGVPLGGLDYRSLMEQVALAMRDSGLLITHVRVNGEDVTGRDLNAIDGLGKPQSLELGVHRPEELVAESLKVTAEMVAPLRRDLATCADQLRIGDEATATLVLFRIIDNFELLKSGVTQMGRILTRYLPGELAVVITGFSGTFEPLLDEVISAQENRDLILLADLLEYELSEGLESWAVAIEPLIETLSKVTVE
ncbi:MAG: hypothetical protein KDC10_10170 [Calditrichaeota bacterium]|nr:hypothetical protein [Candidatus Cloacimonadota bacterium]MCA9786457.1 hypothetical protein [Candidatus Cloacimonadota bacterium]MCB1047553.1 hypothetical protein [Calditrichota bacterium]MCB9472836.1 hypothetical protein [Candidatus Delongbacteria bacterium]